MRPALRFLGGLLPAFLAANLAHGAEAPSAAAREAADRLRTKVVVLKMPRASSRGFATGFLVGPGLVLTAGHAVKDEAVVTAWVNGVGYRADVAAVHPERDVALLRLRAPDLLLKPVTLSTKPDPEAGEELVILAGPSQPAAARGDPVDRIAIPAAFRARVSLRSADGKPGPMLAVNAAIHPGDSGCPLLRVKDGTVLGVVTSRELPDANGVSRSAYAVPADLFQPWLAERLRGSAADDDFYLFRLPNGG